MGILLDNTRRIFEIAQASDAPDDFAILNTAEGGLHFLMETPFSMEAAAAWSGARTAWRVTRSRGSVRVEGRGDGTACVLEERKVKPWWMTDRPSYTVTPAITPAEQERRPVPMLPAPR